MRNILSTGLSMKAVLLSLMLSMAVIAGNASAAAPAMDFSGILAGLSGTTAVTAVIAAAAILALVGFAAWGAKKVARFFG